MTDTTDLIAAIRLDPEFGATANGCFPDSELAIQIHRARATTVPEALAVGRRLSLLVQRAYRYQGAA